MAREVVAQRNHLLIAHAFERRVGNVVEADKVDAAVQPVEQADKGIGMAARVVNALENDVFKGEPALRRAFRAMRNFAAKILLLQKGRDVGDAEGFFGGHECGAVGRYGVMQADGEVAAALVEETD